ncbi:hypothetical protein PAPHI01_0168 [Pancytospora philotis]|nr:hypothetical protein PAPHI01_0168 [Pancytospora philotis]
MVYGTKVIGSKYSPSFKAYVTEDGSVIAPFHDIPLFAGKYINCVNEIPRFETAKFEISKSEPFNPIVQDTDKSGVRFVNNVYPFHGYQFNYGALPQTWEDPSAVDRWAGVKGDNDPVDVLEIGSRRKGIGEVYQAKVLGALGLLDGDEADWKIFVIDAEDVNANLLNDISDIPKVLHPDLLQNALNWFRDYKVPKGKPANRFALDGEFQDASFAMDIINESHKCWKELCLKGYDGISLANSRLEGSKHRSTGFKVEGLQGPDAALPESIYEYSYVFDK